MGGLLPESTPNFKGLMPAKESMPYNGNIPANTDLNTLSQGVWIKTSETTGLKNAPDSVGSDSFLIEIRRYFGQTIGVGTGYQIQTITSQNGATFKRIYWNNAWQSWKSL
ncbi:MAG TPA: pyocin knob domain-containing protein [Bacteroides mediterraneensis]|uniref:pyocin knob domain-containing protein n=1 Tax=Bacteroides mediterraneensis TaxID=1841856 RepID=UPI0026ECFF6D|nr:pyocin knob domain-containing protein [Bacteroides mediterraneensis]HJH64781.1 pyocin knob domain-containing protein [Bacteroides mediterraneensis]